uniref:STAS domain-containing protein n=1 Tax=Strigamia maritima TaxID=126957 RepID=T1IYZ8_STRMM
MLTEGRKANQILGKPITYWQKILVDYLNRIILLRAIYKLRPFNVAQHYSRIFRMRSFEMTNSDNSIRERIKKTFIEKQVNKVALEKVRACCRKQTPKRRIPIIQSLNNYTANDLLRDALAGITVGMTIIPQAMIFANVAHVPVQYGLYSSIMGCFVYSIFGTVKEINVGPSPQMDLLIARHSFKGGPEYTVLLCFLSGCVEVLFALLNLGFLLDFISAPVVAGFSSAAAVMITGNQMKAMFGFSFTSENFFVGMYHLIVKIPDCNYWDLLVGCLTLFFLLATRKIGMMQWVKKSNPDESDLFKITRHTVNFLCMSRNSLVVIFAAAVAYYLIQHHEIKVLSLTDDIEKNVLPPIQLPYFTITREDNSTESFIEICKELGGGILMVPLLSILQHIVIVKVFIGGRTIDASQEMIALGLTNILASFISALPTTSNLPRSALMASSGIRSPIGGLFSGVVVILTMGTMGNMLQYIPRASLSAMTIAATIFMIRYDIIPHLWRTKKIDLCVMLITFFGCVGVGADYGILFGLASSVFVLLYSSARPDILVDKTHSLDREYILVQPDRTLSFPAVEYLRKKVIEVEGGRTPVIFDGTHLCNMDYTVAQCLKQMTDEFKKRDHRLLFANLRPHVLQVIQGMGAPNLVYYATRAEAELSLTDCKKLIINKSKGTDVHKI